MSITFNLFAGIHRLGLDKTSIEAPYLDEAENADIDDKGMLTRRRGHGSALIAGNYHSLWSNHDRNFTAAVTGSTLVAVNADYSTAVIRSGLTTGLRMDYVGVNGCRYDTNGQVYNFIDETRNDGSWPAITKTGGSRMPAGHMIEYYEGRIWIAVGNRLFYSEYLDFGRIALRRNFFQFPGWISMVKAVADGIFIGCGRIYFLAGAKPAAMAMPKLADYDAVPYTATKINAELLGGKVPMSGDAVMWLSTEGPRIGLAQGIIVDPTGGNYRVDSAIDGTAVIRENHRNTTQLLTVVRQ